jgi:hypothetical protein
MSNWRMLRIQPRTVLISSILPLVFCFFNDIILLCGRGSPRFMGREKAFMSSGMALFTRVGALFRSGAMPIESSM